MVIRSASAEDFDAVMAIERQSHFHSWPDSVLRRYLSKPDTAWVVESADQIVAYAVITLIAGEAELLMIAVDPRQQGQGVGRKLMNFLHDYLCSRGAEQWFLDVRESNHKAIGLYESLGFCQAGCRTDYYPTERGHEDALLYCLDLEA